MKGAVSHPPPPSRPPQLAGSLALRLMGECLEVLDRATIPAMPLKGVHLLLCFAGMRGHRDMADVDILVPPETFDKARGCLQSMGFVDAAHTACGVTFCRADWPLSIDLHHRLFRPHLFSLHTQQVFSRGRRKHSAFTAPFVQMNQLDALAHLIGHWVKSRGSLDTSTATSDIVHVLSSLEHPTLEVAGHLRRTGLARAAGLVLDHDVLRSEPDARRLRAALQLESVDSLCIAAVRRRPLARWGPHLLNDRLSRGARSWAAHVAEFVQRSR